MGVLFAAGAVSGTLLSFEMGILWPGLMDRFGEVFGFPFVLEGFAFFIEAIFVGIYLFGWDRLPPRAHMLSALPMIVSGMAGAFFVVAANAWMNNPTGFRLDAEGRVVDAEPWAAMFGPSTWPQVVHMLLAAYMVTGFAFASVYAVGDAARAAATATTASGLLIPLTVAAVITPVQIGVGDWIANIVADNQPVKLAAMEGLYETSAGAPLSRRRHLRRRRAALRAGDPERACRCWSTTTRTASSSGLEECPGRRAAAGQRGAPGLRHDGRDRHRRCCCWRSGSAGPGGDGAACPRSPWFLRAVAVSGVAAIVAMEAGWVTTEVGRQPWIVYGVMRTADAVSPAPGLLLGFYAVVVDLRCCSPR